MKIKRFNESKQERTYINDGEGQCPVCGNWKQIFNEKSTIDENGYIIDYKCNFCQFEWHESYITIFDACYDNSNGEDILEGKPIDSRLYSESGIKRYEISQDSEKYNL